jgi:hypothetical protein
MIEINFRRYKSIMTENALLIQYLQIYNIWEK